MNDISLDPQVIDTTGIEGQFVGVNVLRTVIGVNLNAGMNGTPKQITVGNARRLRVSSQSLKRAMREWTHQYISADEQAVRTRKIPSAIASQLAQHHGRDYQDALGVADALLLGCGKFSIVAGTPDRTEEIAFIPTSTVETLARIADAHWDDLDEQAEPGREKVAEAAAAPATGKKPKGAAKNDTKLASTALPSDVKKQVVSAFAPGASIEIALNGRMLTALPATGAIEAATSVAHAYSVDPLILTTDEWSAKDDWQDDGFDDPTSGAAMMDKRYLSSGTLFQWAALDRHQLRANLAATSGLTGSDLDEAARTAERLFVSSAAWAVPGAAAHSTGSQAAPGLVAATVADTPPLTPPVFTDAITDNVLVEAATRLGAYLTSMEQFRPVTGGRILWNPDNPTANLPTFPDTMTRVGH